MATTTKAAAPAKKNSGFQGVKAAWIILLICAAAGYGVWYFVMGNPDNFVGGDRTGHPANLLGTVYKGGFVVGLILTLLFTVICLGIERFFAIKTASGKINLAKFTSDVKNLIKAQKFDEAKALCNKMQGTVGNVVLSTISMYQTVEGDDTLKKAAKIVLGMIGSFQALSAGGGADSMALSAGISEALVNTASGILTSWVATVVYNFFSNKIDKLTYAMDEIGFTVAATYDSNHNEA